MKCVEVPLALILTATILWRLLLAPHREGYDVTLPSLDGTYVRMGSAPPPPPPPCDCGAAIGSLTYEYTYGSLLSAIKANSNLLQSITSKQ